jgi:hypothetical protein
MQWADGLLWGPNIVSGSFLIRREMEGRKRREDSDSISTPRNSMDTSETSERTFGSAENMDVDDETSNGYRYKPDGLIRKSMRITTSDGQRFHLVSYFSAQQENTAELPTPTADSILRRRIQVRGMYRALLTLEGRGLGVSLANIEPNSGVITPQPQLNQCYRDLSPPPHQRIESPAWQKLSNFSQMRSQDASGHHLHDNFHSQSSPNALLALPSNPSSAVPRFSDTTSSSLLVHASYQMATLPCIDPAIIGAATNPSCRDNNLQHSERVLQNHTPPPDSESTPTIADKQTRPRTRISEFKPAEVQNPPHLRPTTSDALEASNGNQKEMEHELTGTGNATGGRTEKDVWREGVFKNIRLRSSCVYERDRKNISALNRRFCV